MAAHYAFARFVEGGATPELPTITLGGTVAEGQPLIYSSGNAVVAVGSTDTTAVFGVAAAGGASGDVIPYYPALPSCLFRTKDVSAALTRGVKYGLVATTLNVDASNTTQTKLKCVEPVDAEGKYGVIFLGWS